jgi:hypothetical protein
MAMITTTIAVTITIRTNEYPDICSYTLCGVNRTLRVQEPPLQYCSTRDVFYLTYRTPMRRLKSR